jgi:hypothetical protein
MKITCPKCRHVRQPKEIAPDWQCPTCGIADAKVAEAQSSYLSPTTILASHTASEKRGVPWIKMLLIVSLLYGAWTGFQVVKKRQGGFTSIGASVGGNLSTEELKALAATVKLDDVVMYTTTSCPYCAQAKGCA